MNLLVAPSSVEGRRAEWLTISREGEEEKGIRLLTGRQCKPTVRSRFEFLGAEFGPEAARIGLRLKISVEVETRAGVLGKGIRTENAAELSIDYVSLFRGTRLQIENIRLAWEADRTLPRKDLEALYASALSSEIPEKLAAGADGQALLLIELLRGSTIRIG
jgi:hypothetical protein